MDHYSLTEVPGNYAGEHPVAAAAIIPTGCFVALVAAGNAVKADAGVVGHVIGRSEAGVDNSGGAAGDSKVLVRRGIYVAENDATYPVTKAHIRKVVYATAPDTVGNQGTCRAGVLIGFDGFGKPMVDTTLSENGNALVLTSTNGTAAAASASLPNLAAETEKIGDDLRALVVLLQSAGTIG